VLQGIVTQTELEAIAGELPEVEGEEPEISERDDGSLLIDGMMSARDAFDRLSLKSADRLWADLEVKLQVCLWHQTDDVEVSR